LTPRTDDTDRDTLLGVLTPEPTGTTAAQDLARQLGLPMLDEIPAQPGLMLRFGTDGLSLTDTDPHGPGAVRVDFADARLQHRIRHASPRREAVARAVGLPGNPGLEVVDATGGLGRDSFVLATLGARVTVLERHPVIHALLEDGWRRALNDPTAAQAAARITPVRADAVDWLASLKTSPRVIYLDPMYPTETKGGKVKKGMRTLQRLLGTAEPVDALFEAAWRAAPDRLVIKRPRRAAVLRSAERKFTLEGRHTRFDVYLVAEFRDGST
jgi:16S rRNA (guanine1516-N2)-methyltransferase